MYVLYVYEAIGKVVSWARNNKLLLYKSKVSAENFRVYAGAVIKIFKW